MDTTECLGVEEGGSLETEELEKADRRHAEGPSELGREEGCCEWWHQGDQESRQPPSRGPSPLFLERLLYEL